MAKAKNFETTSSTCAANSSIRCLSFKGFAAQCPAILYFIFKGTHMKVVNLSLLSASNFADRKRAALLDARYSASCSAETPFSFVRSHPGCYRWGSYVSN